MKEQDNKNLEIKTPKRQQMTSGAYWKFLSMMSIILMRKYFIKVNVHSLILRVCPQLKI